MRGLPPLRTGEHRLLRTRPQLAEDGRKRPRWSDEVERRLGTEASLGRVAFIGRLLTLCALPRRSRGNERRYVRRNGPYTMIVTATGPPGLPFGTLPRLLLVWISTEAVRTQSPRVRLGATLADFMRQLGLRSKSGGDRGDRTRLRDQIRRLFGASIRLTYRGPSETRSVASMVADQPELWWGVQSPGSRPPWQRSVRLGPGLFPEILRQPVPVNLASVRALKQCPLGLDLYLWLTYAVFGKKHERRVPWPLLYRQFADCPRDSYDKRAVQNFRAQALRELRKIKEVWPHLQYGVQTGYRGKAGALVLRPTSPDIAPRPGRDARSRTA